MFPSSVVTVIVAEPGATAVTVPFDTVATSLLLLDHCTFWFSASSGYTVAFNKADSPSVRDSDVGLTDTFSTLIIEASSRPHAKKNRVQTANASVDNFFIFL